MDTERKLIHFEIIEQNGRKAGINLSQAKRGYKMTFSVVITISKNKDIKGPEGNLLFAVKDTI